MSATKKTKSRNPLASSRGKKTLLYGLALISIVTGVWTRWRTPVPVIAVLDTGFSEVDSSPVKLAPQSMYRNFLEPGAQISDQDGHGTRVAKVAYQACAHTCAILPFKVSERGEGMSADLLAQAIEAAIEAEVAVINVSLGVTVGSTALDAAILKAHASRIPVVVAAGTGIPNPFKPVELQDMHPQANLFSIVVGAARVARLPDLTSNYGARMDLIVLPPEGNDGVFLKDEPLSFGSSFGAASVSGWLAAAIAREGVADPVAWRMRLRASSRVPLERAEARERDNVYGSGAFDPAIWRGLKAQPFYAHAVTGASPRMTLFTFELPGEFASFPSSGHWVCASRSEPQMVKFDPLPTHFPKKGRYAFKVSDPEPSKGCRLQISWGGKAVAFDPEAAQAL